MHPYFLNILTDVSILRAFLTNFFLVTFHFQIVDRLWDFVNDEPENSDEEDDEGEPLAVKK